MARSNIYFKAFVALLVIVAILVIWKFYKMPDPNEEITEEIEEIEWEEIDRITFISDNDVQISKVDGEYMVMVEDTTYAISHTRVSELFNTFNNLKTADLKSVEYEQWVRNIPDTTARILKLYRNTEEKLNLYIIPGENKTYFRYLQDSNIYETSRLTNQQFRWLDSISRSDY